MPRTNFDTATNGQSFPYGLSAKQLEEIRIKASAGGGTLYSLSREYFGFPSSRNYMRIRRIVHGSSHVKIGKIAKKRIHPHAPKEGKGLHYPYGLSDDQILELLSAYNDGLGYPELGERYWNDRYSFGYQRAKAVVRMGAGDGLVTLRKLSAKRGRPAIKSALNKSRPPQATMVPSRDVVAKRAMTEPGEGAGFAREAVLFADLATLYAGRLHKSVLRGNRPDTAHYYNRLRGALKDLTVSLPEEAAGNVESV